MQIGEMILRDEPIEINEGDKVEITVNNTGDRCIQVCSHYHFFETNPALRFDRVKAYGMRLDIPSGNAVRFEPGEDKVISLVGYKGKREVKGFRGLVMGALDDPKVKERALGGADK